MGIYIIDFKNHTTMLDASVMRLFDFLNNHWYWFLGPKKSIFKELPIPIFLETSKN